MAFLKHTALLIALASTSVQAGIINGTPTANNDPNQVGTVLSGGVVEYFIPLLPAPTTGVYGVSDGGNYGTVSDVDSAPLGGADLDMYLFFDIDEGNEVGNSLSFWFDDLDLASTNDPIGFFETISINGGTQTNTWDELELIPNLTIDPFTNNSGTNEVTFTISNLNITEDYWLGLSFTSYSEGLSGRFRNTAEYLSASLNTVNVPEPALISLLGAGLIGLGFARRKVRKS